MSKKYKKSNLIVGALLIYTTFVAIYFVFISDVAMDMERTLTIVFSYAIIAILGVVLRKKERLKNDREDDLNNNKKKLT